MDSVGVAAVRGDEGFQAVGVSMNPTTINSSNNNNNQFQVQTMSALQSTAIVAVPTPTEEVLRKKRGRPRKYGPGGAPLSTALSPMPISASIPLSGWKQQPQQQQQQQPQQQPQYQQQQQPTSTKIKPYQPIKKAHKLELQGIGDKLPFVVGADFTSHVITVNAGEDVAMKVLSFSQEGSRAICVLSASGSISNVTLRQPSSAGGTLTYEGRFEILSLSGSFMPTENGMLKSRSGGMSVSLAGPNGRVLGGGLAGLLIAANPVQVVVGSFLPGTQHEQQKPKKQRLEPVSAPAPAPFPTPAQGPIYVSPHNGSAIAGGGNGAFGGQTLSFHSPMSTHTDPVASLNSTQDSKDADTDNNLSSSSPLGESDDDSPSGYEIFG